MSSTGFRQRWEKMRNRDIVVSLLFERSYRFNELFEASGFSSKSTLNKHLNGLIDEGVIEKVIEQGRPVYRITMDPDVLVSEGKNQMYDNLINFFDKKIPGIKLLANSFLLTIARLKIEQRLREIKREPTLTEEEVETLFLRYYEECVFDLDPNYDESKLVKILDFINEIFETHQSETEVSS